MYPADIETPSGRPRYLGVPVLGVVVANLPLALVMGLSALVLPEVGLGAASYGAIVGLHFLTGAMSSIPLSAVVARFGPTTVLRICSGVSAATLLGLSRAEEAWQLAALLAVAGTAMVGCLLSANQIIATTASAGRQGLAFGIVQASIPIALVLGGLALPVVGVPMGWRAAFVAFATLPLALAALIPRDHHHARALDRSSHTLPRGLALMAVGGAAAAAVGNSLPAFVVTYTTVSGHSADYGGTILAAGSAAVMVTRIAAGIQADRSHWDALLMMVTGLLLGSLGLAIMATSVAAAPLALGVVLSMSGSWGWTGLLHLAVTRASGDAAARAMGIVLAGPMIGSVIGPMGVGWIAQQAGYRAVWIALATLAVLAAGVIAAARLARDLDVDLNERGSRRDGASRGT